MKKVFSHRGYSGSMEISQEDQCLYGKILFVNDLVTYEAETVPELESEFREAVDDYLETCQELGVSPDKPFSGTFNVRIGEELHQAAAKSAYMADIKLNDFVKQAIKERLERGDKQVIRHLHYHLDLEYSSNFQSNAHSSFRGIKIDGTISHNSSKPYQSKTRFN
jgi:predicted HicB family RNase H-like nuclease